jgi:hypothetical protein
VRGERPAGTARGGAWCSEQSVRACAPPPSPVHALAPKPGLCSGQDLGLAADRRHERNTCPLNFPLHLATSITTCRRQPRDTRVRAAAACVAMLIQISVMFSAYQLPTTRVQPLVGRPASIGGRAMPLRMHQAEAPLRRALHTYSAHHTCPCACACAASRERMVRRLAVPRPRPLPRTTTRGSPTPPSTTHGAPPL